MSFILILHFVNTTDVVCVVLGEGPLEVSVNQNIYYRSQLCNWLKTSGRIRYIRNTLSCNFMNNMVLILIYTAVLLQRLTNIKHFYCKLQ